MLKKLLTALLLPFLLFQTVRCRRLGYNDLRGRSGDVVQGSGLASPPQLLYGKEKVVQRVSQFDDGGFHPGGNPYRGKTFSPVTEQNFVDGPPLGDNYQTELQLLQQLQQQQLELRLLQLEKQQQRNSFGNMAESLSTKPNKGEKKPIRFETTSPLLGDTASFSPNKNWFGQKETGLLRYHYDTDGNSRNDVQLDGFSPATSSKTSFTPRDTWTGEKNRYLAEPSTLPRKYPLNSRVKLETVSRQVGTGSQTGNDFVPSNWLPEYTDRRTVPQDEADVITIDNVHRFSPNTGHAARFGSSGSPDIFTVNVVSSYTARGATANY